MIKPAKKLTLSTETVRDLAANELRAAVGGSVVIVQKSAAHNCPPGPKKPQ